MSSIDDDIRPPGTIEVQCVQCEWFFWMDPMDPLLPDGPFVCPSCVDRAPPKADTWDDTT